MATTKERIRERRLDRMRLGQAVCDYVTMPSDPEIRICIVPLTEAQFQQVLEKVAALTYEDNMAGAAVRDRAMVQETLVRAIREEDNLMERVYGTPEEMMEDFDTVDIDHLWDSYGEMTEKASPSIQGIPEAELEELKKVLQTMDWNELSGSAWYAAKRFLSRISPQLLKGSLLGSTPINSSITTSE